MELYNISQHIAKGSYGTIHLCTKKHNNEKLVVKQIHTDYFKGEDLKLAKNEVLILKSLNHPNIIQYYDSCIQNHTFFIVMEYASHGSLQDHIAKERPNLFSPQAVMDFFCQILSGLHHIHEKNIIHRDLKCENVFLTGVYKDVLKIGDFGISKQLLSKLNVANTVIGTCNYLAPELCDGKPYNTKSDIWALGCILYEMCAMEKMFDGSVSNVVLSIAKGQKKPIDAKRYGRQMQELLELLLQVDPEKRPETKMIMTLGDVAPTLWHLGTKLGCL